jgi:RNA polymerase sigma-70 factor (ECF subfamily)
MSAVILSLRAPNEEAELSDEALLAACAVRDSEALALLFRRHHRTIYRFLCRMHGHRGDHLDDLVQSTFLEAWTHAGSFKRRSSVRTWLIGIASNLARNHARTADRRRRALRLLTVEPAPTATALDDLVASKQLMHRIRDALSELPHHLREAYVMCELEEIPGVEAARAVGVRPGTMWRRLHQARRRLRDMIEVKR